MKRVIVTGGSGKVGRACIDELLRHGYEVFNVDIENLRKNAAGSRRSTSPISARR
jgi:nucleoside-diphosphate-sugar epimerase